MSITFKQFLSELMVDIDPSQDVNTQIQDIRKTSMNAQRSPATVAKQQADAATKNRQQVDADDSEPANIKSLKAQIARNKEQLFRLQQQLVRQQESNKARQPNNVGQV